MTILGMSNMNAALVAAIKADLHRALTDIGKNHGVVFEQNAGTFTQQKLSLRVTGIVSEAALESTLAKAFRSRAKVDSHLNSEWLGALVTFKGVELKVRGYKTRSAKNPVILEDISSGRLYATSVADLAQAMGAEKKVKSEASA
jgi:hypothetical protein